MNLPDKRFYIHSLMQEPVGYHGFRHVFNVFNNDTHSAKPTKFHETYKFHWGRIPNEPYYFAQK